MKYALELSAYEVRYEPREAIKAQVLADFVNEYIGSKDVDAREKLTWIIYVDGLSTSRGGGEEQSWPGTTGTTRSEDLLRIEVWFWSQL